MHRIGDLFSGFLEQISEDRELSLLFLQELWPRIVGEDLAGKTRPLALAGSSLTIGVAGEEWLHQLASMRPMLLRSINQFWQMRLVDKIHLKVHLNI